MKQFDNKVIPKLKAWKQNAKYFLMVRCDSHLIMVLMTFTVTPFQKIIFRFQIFQILEREKLLQSKYENLHFFFL